MYCGFADIMISAQFLFMVCTEIDIWQKLGWYGKDFPFSVFWVV